MTRILIVEDEKDIREVLRFHLSNKGYEVLQSGTCKEALEIAKRFEPELVLLDVMLPDGSGFHVCSTLRKTEWGSKIKVLFLTAKGEENDRLNGFELGAEDYVIKPFSVKELMFRIDAILRRTVRESAPPRPLNTSYRFGVLEVDVDAHRLLVSGEEIALTALEFRLFLTLFERKNKVQSRQVLLSDVWDIQADITTRTVDTHVKRLREKLKEAGVYIETVRGVGYRFVEEASSLEASK